MTIHHTLAEYWGRHASVHTSNLMAVLEFSPWLPFGEEEYQVLDAAFSAQGFAPPAEVATWSARPGMVPMVWTDPAARWKESNLRQVGYLYDLAAIPPDTAPPFVWASQLPLRVAVHYRRPAARRVDYVAVTTCLDLPPLLHFNDDPDFYGDPNSCSGCCARAVYKKLDEAMVRAHLGLHAKETAIQKGDRVGGLNGNWRGPTLLVRDGEVLKRLQVLDSPPGPWHAGLDPDWDAETRRTNGQT